MTAPELVARARSGDRSALEALLLELAPQMERFARRLCGSRFTDVDDVLQDALWLVAQHLPEFEGKSALSSWTFALVRSACARRRRGAKNAPHQGLDAVVELASDAPSPERATLDVERRRQVAAALDALPAEHREVLALRDVEGLTAEEAAASLGIGVAALKSRLHRARAALRSALAPVFAPGALPPEASCPDVVQALSTKLENDLAPAACTLLEAHVAGCSRCGALCDTLKQASLVCRQLRSDPSEARAAELRRLVAQALRQH
jgi:RNA polymerase sigma-70 factor (ECF subfamily)